MTDWLLDLPKIELHCHLEGSMSSATVKALAARHDPDWSWVWTGDIPDHFSFVDFPDFGRQYLFGLSLLRSEEDLATITDDLAATLARQNVRYAELTTTAFSHLAGSCHPRCTATVSTKDAAAAARGVDISWVIDIPRDLEMPDDTMTIDYLESGCTPDGLVGIGLGGYEVGFPAAPYAEHFARARALGLHAVPHAGETEGADSVRQAVDDLARRTDRSRRSRPRGPGVDRSRRRRRHHVRGLSDLQLPPRRRRRDRPPSAAAHDGGRVSTCASTPTIRAGSTPIS